MNYIIGIIGAGSIGHALASHLSKTNYQVLVTNSRGPETLKEMITSLGGSLAPANLQETIDKADVLFLAAPWSKLDAIAEEMASYAGKIIVDATNNIVSVNPFQLADTGSKTTGEYVSGLFPTHSVVKAFNTLAAATLAKQPQTSEGKRVIFMSGDHAHAKNIVQEIITTMGFAPIDIGSYKEGGKLQDFGGALASIELIKVT